MDENLTQQMAEAAEQEKPDKETVLATLAPHIKRQIELTEKISDAEETLKRYQKEYFDLAIVKIPEILAEYGIKEGQLTLENGLVLEIKEIISASITKANKETAHKWLREKGFGDLIKREVTATFGKGEDEQAEEITTNLIEQGFNVSGKESVHASTLKSFVREQLKKELDIPEKLFGIYRGVEARVK